MISLNKELIKQIEAHGERTFPYECGGMLIGRFENGKKTVVELLPMENAAAQIEQHNRVLILPKDVLRAERPDLVLVPGSGTHTARMMADGAVLSWLRAVHARIAGVFLHPRR